MTTKTTYPGRPLLDAGSTATARTAVTGADLAGVLNQTLDDAFPPVYATSRMIGLMELAAARVMRPMLRAGELSVGVALDIRHTAATPVGVAVEAEARFLGIEGRVYLFEVVARDAGGEVGRGTHRRAVVDARRLVQAALVRSGVEAAD